MRRPVTQPSLATTEPVPTAPSGPTAPTVPTAPSGRFRGTRLRGCRLMSTTTESVLAAHWGDRAASGVLATPTTTVPVPTASTTPTVPSAPTTTVPVPAVSATPTVSTIPSAPTIPSGATAPTVPRARCRGARLRERRPMSTTTTESVPAAQCGATQPRERRR